MTEPDDPPALSECSPAAKRTFDALRRADRALSKRDLVEETRYAERTIDSALSELRAENLVVGWGWPRRYRLDPSESSQ
jgi:hypothetical protein